MSLAQLKYLVSQLLSLIWVASEEMLSKYCPRCVLLNLVRREFTESQLQLFYGVGIGAQTNRRIIRQKKHDKSTRFSAWLSLEIDTNRMIRCRLTSEDIEPPVVYWFPLKPNLLGIDTICDFDVFAAYWLGYYEGPFEP